MSDEAIPRRNCVDRMTEAELAIYHAQQAVEEAGASPMLTEAVELLERARNLVADHVDAAA